MMYGGGEGERLFTAMKGTSSSTSSSVFANKSSESVPPLPSAVNDDEK